MENINNVINEKIEGLCGTLKCCKYCDSDEKDIEKRCKKAVQTWFEVGKPNEKDAFGEIKKLNDYWIKKHGGVSEEFDGGNRWFMAMIIVLLGCALLSPKAAEESDNEHNCYKMKNCCCVPPEGAKSESGNGGNGNIVLTPAEFGRIINDTKHSTIDVFSLFLKERFAKITNYEPLCVAVDDIVNKMK